MKTKILTASLLALLFVAPACSRNEEPAAPAEAVAEVPAAPAALSGSETFTVLVGGTDIGQVEVSHAGDGTQVG